MQGEVGLLMEVPGGTATGQKTFDKMTMDMNVKMKFYDQNKPVSIIVPQEAKNAVEMPATPSLTSTPRQY